MDDGLHFKQYDLEGKGLNAKVWDNLVIPKDILAFKNLVYISGSKIVKKGTRDVNHEAVLIKYDFTK